MWSMRSFPNTKLMPKIVDHDQYRKELLGKSFHLFAQQGYSAITMRQLAEGLSVSTGTLYHYFPSKQAIFEQMMLERVENSIRTFDASLANLASFKAKLTAVFQYFEHEQKEATDELVLYVEFHQHQQREGQTNNVIQQIYQRIAQEATHLLGVKDETLLQFLFSIIDGLLLAHIYGATINWKAQAELISTMVESYLQPSKTSQAKTSQAKTS
jgi:AcrR family transcriptional regulator